MNNEDILQWPGSTAFHSDFKWNFGPLGTKKLVTAVGSLFYDKIFLLNNFAFYNTHIQLEKLKITI